MVIGALGLGLTYDDIDRLDIGSMFDLFTAKNNAFIRAQNEAKEKKKKEKKNWRWATQADFDKL